MARDADRRAEAVLLAGLAVVGAALAIGVGPRAREPAGPDEAAVARAAELAAEDESAEASPRTPIAPGPSDAFASKYEGRGADELRRTLDLLERELRARRERIVAERFRLGRHETRVVRTGEPSPSFGSADGSPLSYGMRMEPVDGGMRVDWTILAPEEDPAYHALMLESLSLRAWMREHGVDEFDPASVVSESTVSFPAF